MADVDVLSGRDERRTIIQLACVPAPVMVSAIVVRDGGISWARQRHLQPVVG
ncbi:MAG: hypothetical protein JJ979_24620 [Roseibium sp.]|nr:hypothetical protein [Roseibium sp.]